MSAPHTFSVNNLLCLPAEPKAFPWNICSMRNHVIRKLCGVAMLPIYNTYNFLRLFNKKARF